MGSDSAKYLRLSPDGKTMLAAPHMMNESVEPQKGRLLFYEMENFKLMTVARFLGIEVDESQLHDALYDVKLTKEIYIRCTQ